MSNQNAAKETETRGAGRSLEGVVIAHAALHGGMMSNFGRLFAARSVEEGAELHFYASTEGVFGQPPPVEELEAIGGVYHGVDFGRTPTFWRYLRGLVFLVREFRRRRVTILHTRSMAMGLVGRIAGTIALVPYIVHHQDDLHFRDESHGPLKRWFFKRFAQALSMLSDKTLFVSDAVLEDAVAAGFNRKKCTNVGHDLSQSFQRALRATEAAERVRHPMLERCGIPAGVPVIGCMARLAPLKGIDTLVAVAEKVCAEHPDCHFLVKGDGPSRDELMRDVERRGLTGRVVFSFETIDADELPQLIRSFDILFLPTRREGFGMAFAEAMAMRVPVVGPRKPPVTEVVADCGILITPEDVDGYADALLRLLGDEALRQEIGSQGYERAESEWMGTRAANRVIDVYEELLER